MKLFKANYLIIFVLSFSVMFFQNCGPVPEESLTEESSNVGQEKGFSCDPTARRKGRTVERLTSKQLENSLSQLFAFLSANEKQDLLNLLSSDLKSKSIVGGMQRKAPFLTRSLLKNYHASFDKIASYIADGGERLSRFIKFYINKKPGSCVLNNLSDFKNVCKIAFLENFGLYAYRRPLEPIEKTLLMSELSAHSWPKYTVNTLLFRMLSSPDFLFKIENKGEQISPTQIKLTAYELASRLSFHFWDSIPDDQLIAAASSGSILTDAGYKTIVDYAFDKSRAQQTIQNFYKGWLGTDEIPSFNTASPQFSYLSKNITYNETMRQAMGDEIRNMTDHYTWDQEGGKFSDLFTTDLVFTRYQPLLDVYNYKGAVPSDFNKNSRLPSSERAGVMTRGAFLVSGDHGKDPVHRGLRVMRKLLCEEVGNPPEDVLAEIEMPTEEAHHELITSRQELHETTSAQSCAACHDRINSHAFALTGYNGLGQFTTEESIFDKDGNFIQKLPVDSRVAFPRFYNSFDVIETPIEFSRKMGTATNAGKCFAKKYYEFAYGVKPDEEADGCALDAVAKTINSDLKQNFKSLVLQDSFKIREIGESL